MALQRMRLGINLRKAFYALPLFLTFCRFSQSCPCRHSRRCRHSGLPAAGRVVLISHSRSAGMTIRGHDNRTRHPTKPAILSLPGPPSSAACYRRRSTTYIHAGVDSSLRWNDGKGNGHIVNYPSCHCHTKEALNESILDSSRPLVPDAALPPASMQAYIPVSESTQNENAIFILLQNQ